MMTAAVNDDRRARRYLVSKQGVIIVGTKSYGEVRILDLSATGARLISTQSVELPEECYLLVEAEQLRYPIHVVWQQDLEIGVTFTGEPEFHDDSDEIC